MAKTKPERPKEKLVLPNKLYYGDNLEILRKYIKDDSIDLCYIDPPFNSKRTYNQIYNRIGKEDKAQAQAFIDTWEWEDMADNGYEEIMTNYTGHFTSQTISLIQGLKNVLGKDSLLAYIVSIALRISEVQRVLKPTGSFYFHCDPTASHYIKLVLDSIFCPNGGDFKSEIIWRRTGAHNKSTRYAPLHDVIFFYTKSDKYTWNKPKAKIPYMRGHVEQNFVKDGNGYRTDYYGNVLTGSGTRGGESGMEWRGFNPTAKGRHWAIPARLVEELDEDIGELSQHEKLDYLYEKGLIKIVEGQAHPMYEHYINPKTDGVNMSDIWAYQPYTKGSVFGTEGGIDEDVRWLGTKDDERLGYPTQKPAGLLERIINISSNKGDVILDAYCGCGTTIEVAERLNRNWIGIDITYQSISLMLKRLRERVGKTVMEKIELNGVPHDMDSAIALANKKDDRVRKEFEKWAVLTYSDNHAIINEKKGGDGGIDGIAYIQEFTKKRDVDYRKILFSVKSDETIKLDYVRSLIGKMSSEEAVMGIFISLYSPTDGTYDEAKKAGKYKNNFLGIDYPSVQIITAKDILEGKRLILPAVEVVKKGKHIGKDNKHQLKLDGV